MTSQTSATSATPSSLAYREMLETCLKCSLCEDFIIDGRTLNCAHTVCHSCLLQLLDQSLDCPNCETLITSVTPNLAIDTLIEMFYEQEPDEVRSERLVRVLNSRDI